MLATQVEIPLPGEEINDEIVIASCWVIDEEGHDAGVYGDDGYARAYIMTIRRQTPYYRVTGWQSRKDGDGWNPSTLVKFFPNIIPATNFYSDLIGGY